MLAKTMTHKQQLWLDHVKAADSSEGTIADYALSHHLKLKALYQWKSKLVKEGLYRPGAMITESGFVPVKAVQTKPDQSGCTVNLPNGIQIEFKCELDSKVIRSIITSAGLRR